MGIRASKERWREVKKLGRGGVKREREEGSKSADIFKSYGHRRFCAHREGDYLPLTKVLI